MITEIGNGDLPNLNYLVTTNIMYLQTDRPKPSQLLFEVHKLIESSLNPRNTLRALRNQQSQNLMQTKKKSLSSENVKQILLKILVSLRVKALLSESKRSSLRILVLT